METPATKIAKAVEQVNQTISNQKGTLARPVNLPTTVSKSKAPKKPLPHPLSQEQFEEWKRFVTEFADKGKKEFSTNPPYVSVEAWSYLFSMLGDTVSITDCSLKEIPGSGGLCEADAVAKLTTENGDEIIAYGYANNFNIQNKVSNRSSAVLSLAQTRAVAKLGRMIYGHLALLAGFSAAPLEEMSELV